MIREIIMGAILCGNMEKYVRFYDVSPKIIYEEETKVFYFLGEIVIVR